MDMRNGLLKESFLINNFKKIDCFHLSNHNKSL
jgi:hypothetical protein